MRFSALNFSLLNSFFLLVFSLAIANPKVINVEAQLRNNGIRSKSSSHLHTDQKISESLLKSSFGKSKNNFLRSSSLDFLSYKKFFASPNLHLKSIRDESSSPFRKWGESPKMEKSNKTEKETKIAEIFMGVAYGSEEKKKKLKPYFIAEVSNKAHGNKLLNQDKNIIKEPKLIDNSIVSAKSTAEIQTLFQQPKRVQKSLKFYQEKPKSLVRENSVPSRKINFSLPQLFLSSEEKSAELGFYYHNPKTLKEDYIDNDDAPNGKSGEANYNTNIYENDYTLSAKTTYSTLMKIDKGNVELDFKDDVKYNKTHANTTNPSTNDYEMDQLGYNHSISMQGYFDKEDLNWTYIHSFHSSSWKYQDYFVLLFFSLVSLFPLFVIFHLQIAKREHVTPRYCFLLMLQLLIVCCSRVVLYCVDPFGLQERFPQFVISIFHILAQSLLIYSTGLFLVILVFPVYSPKSQVLPRLLAAFFLSLFYAKLGTFLFVAYKGNYKALKAVQRYVTAVDFGEIGSLFIGYIFLNLCTRQRHKVWWIRLYKKSLSSSNSTFSVLYSFLKKAIRYGTGASFILLINTFWVISVNFNLNLFYLSLYTNPLSGWILENIKRISEGLACSFLAIGSCYLFVPKERLVFRKRSSLKALADVIKGRRRSGSQSSISKVMQPLNIFTLNRGRKATDYATTDFQLVWNQNRALPLAAMAEATDNKRRRSAKSLDFEETSCVFGKSKDMKLSHSVDILNGVYESKSHGGSFAIYDNLQHDKNRTPIYQNQYFHYNYRPKVHEGVVVESNICKSSSSLSNNNNNFANQNKRKSKRKPRPKSYMEERPKVNENYLTSYFSILSMDRFADEDHLTKSYALTQHHRTDQSESKTLLPYSTEDITAPLRFSIDEINSPMISDEKWKDIKITPKSCTIKINSKNMKKKLPTSKSVDFF